MNINLNFVWTTVFVKRLENLGLKYVCISPGSRSTPLTLAFAESKKIKSFVFADERQSAYFALGLAKKTSTPVAIVTTSGTATAEVYPAIIEAYQTCVPLIVCTADRPYYLRNTGANQTINQENLYRNHINFFADLRLPKLTDARLSKLIKITDKAFSISNKLGPVHLNFPFEKPLEPWVFNIEFDEGKIDYYANKDKQIESEKKHTVPKRIFKEIKKASKLLILLGGNLSEKVNDKILRFSKKHNIPIIADGTNAARFSKNSSTIISYGSAILKSGIEKFEPQLIISFGKAPTTNPILEFYKKSSAVKILVNSKNRINDPTRTYNFFVNLDEIFFVKEIEKLKVKIDKSYLEAFVEAENEIENFVKQNFITNDLKFEGNVVKSIIKNIPEKSILFLGNSTIPRDFDYFSGKFPKSIKIYSNRGASGIDGIISTAAGISKALGKRIYLYIGDLSFYYDVNFLHYLKELKIPLTIVLQNNNGGGIFELLPVADKRKHFQKYFKMPLKIDFEKIVLSYGIKYYLIQDEKELEKLFKKFETENKTPIVFEIKTEAEYSKSLRNKFFNEVNILLNKKFDS